MSSKKRKAVNRAMRERQALERIANDPQVKELRAQQRMAAGIMGDFLPSMMWDAPLSPKRKIR